MVVTVTRWLSNPTTIYRLVTVLALARAITLTNQQNHNHHQASSSSLNSHNVTRNQQATPYPERNHTNNESSARNHATPTTGQQRRVQEDERSPGASLARSRLQGSHVQSSGYDERDLPARNTSSARQLSTHIDNVSHQFDHRSTMRLPPTVQADDTRVPFWNIAHMVNSIEEVNSKLSAGANGIETDISFDERGRPIEAYHGFPCDCGRHCHYREDLVKFVRHIARITVPPASSRLLVVLFDLKLKDLKETHQKETAGLALAEILHKNLYAEYEQRTNVRSRSALERNLAVTPPLRTIISINHAHDLPLTRAFLGYLQRNRLEFMSQFIGWDVGMNDPLENITTGWDSLRGATVNIWQGDGLTNCANIVRGVERLKEAISIRNEQGHFRKVYYWTADVLYHIRSVLRLGLDAILTNQPERAIQVLNEPEFRGKYRLATPHDDPFQQFWISASAWRMSFPSVKEINETVANIQKTGENFIKTIPDGVAAALKKVQSSIG